MQALTRSPIVDILPTMAISTFLRRATPAVLISVLVVGGCAADPDLPSATPVGDTSSATIPTLSPTDVADADRILSELQTALPDLDPALVDAVTTSFDEQGPWHRNDLQLIVQQSPFSWH